MNPEVLEPISQPDANTEPAREGRYVRVLLPLAILAMLLAGTVLFWRLKEDSDRRGAQLALKTSGKWAASRATRLIEAEIDRAARLRSEFLADNIQNAAEFERMVQTAVKPGPALLAVGWLGRDGTIAFAWSRGGEDDIRAGVELKKRSSWSYSLGRAQSDREIRVPQIQTVGGRRQICAIVPVVSGEGSSAAYIGSIVLRLDAELALANLLDERDLENYSVEITDGGVLLLARGEPIGATDDLANFEAMKLFNRFFTVRTRPTASLLAQHSGRSALRVLWLGIPLSFLVTGIVWLVMERRARAGEEARRQVRALEELTRTAGHIAAAPASNYEALNDLAASARHIVRTSSASISLVDPASDTLTMVAVDGLPFDKLPRVFPLSQTPGTARCFESGEMLVVEDVAGDARVNPTLITGLGVQSVIFVPLRVEGRPIGVLHIGHDRPRKFTPAEIRLAALLGSQAAVILANSRLAVGKDAALAMQKTLQAQREALFQVSTEMYRFDGMDESLQRLADAAPAIMGADLCVISIKPDAGTMMRIHAVTGNCANCRWETYDSAGTVIEQAWAEGRVIVIEDAQTCPNIHPAYRDRLRVGSAMYVPLVGSARRPIGVMVFVRHLPGGFTREQTELASVVAARASTAIEQTRLYHETRRNVEIQEMLLRELQHRVKNNLASIVTLLQLGRPEMPETARRWLNRVSSRVATMARTHELFIGPDSTVNLADLINRLLPTLAANMAAGVDIRADPGDVPVRLSSDRAVSLAMVLNELCWNALEEGEGNAGVLTIRARPAAPGRVVIELEHAAGVRPGALAAEAGASRSCGMGMRLVAGLVARELNGTFTIEREPGGSSLARVEMPLGDGSREGRV